MQQQKKAPAPLYGVAAGTWSSNFWGALLRYQSGRLTAEALPSAHHPSAISPGARRALVTVRDHDIGLEVELFGELRS